MVDNNTTPFVVPEARILADDDYRKSSTLNSMYVATTINKPNVDSIINAVATILHSQMLEDFGDITSVPEDSEMFFFSEEKYIQEKPEAFDP